jgi:putative aldouronate transport system permease protein
LEASVIDSKVVLKRKKGSGKLGRILRRPWLYILLIPGVLQYIIFQYMPIFWKILAFKDYNPYAGFIRSPWVGFEHFRTFFSIDAFGMLMRNTLIFFALSTILFFPLPIVLSLMLNEIKNVYFKRTIQTFVYLPHFVSWIVIYGMTYMLLTPEGGLIPNILSHFGKENVNILMDPVYFRPLIILQQIWKECGWGTIIFLAALAGVPVELYESAIIDGANRWNQMIHITIPSIKTTIVTLLILRMGGILDTGFTQIFLMITPMTRNVGEVFDTYIYQNGIVNGSYSFTTAVEFFKAIVGLIFIQTANYLSKKVGEEGIY